MLASGKVTEIRADYREGMHRYYIVVEIFRDKFNQFALGHLVNVERPYDPVFDGD